MSVTQLDCYHAIRQSVEDYMNQRLRQDYEKLKTRFTTLPPLPHIRVQFINNNQIPITNDNPQCVALKRNGQRCLKPLQLPTNLCAEHSAHPPEFRLDILPSCWQDIQSTTTKSAIKDWQAVNFNHQKGRKYYEIPEEHHLEDLYLEVEHVVINSQPYLQDKSGLIYSFSTPVRIKGRQEGDLIVWYK